LARRNIRGVPAFFIGEDVVVGFDKAKILALVDHRVMECEQCHAKLRVPIDKGSLKVTCPQCKHVFDWTPR
jgi:glutaredoxin 3